MFKYSVCSLCIYTSQVAQNTGEGGLSSRYVIHLYYWKISTSTTVQHFFDIGVKCRDLSVFIYIDDKH